MFRREKSLKESKIIVSAIALILAVSITVTVWVGTIKGNAASGDYAQAKINSVEATADMDDYAQNIAILHLQALGESEDKDYKLGNSFSVIDTMNNEPIYYYPVIKDDSIEYLLQVNALSETNGFSSSLSDFFADQLNELLDSNSVEAYTLLTDGVSLQVYDGNTSTQVYQLYYDNGELDDTDDIKEDNLAELYCQEENDYEVVELTKDDIMDSKNIENLEQVSSESVSGRKIDVPKDISKTLNVKGVDQGNNPWCWAATCAAMINYRKGTNLSAKDVTDYVGNKGGGTWDDMKKAYNYWKVSVSQEGRKNFSEIKTQINNDIPMHLGLTGHSVGLIGYKQHYTTKGSTDILILLEPNGGVRRSVTLNSNGNFNYTLGSSYNEVNAWNYTRIIKKN